MRAAQIPQFNLNIIDQAVAVVARATQACNDDPVDCACTVPRS